MTADGWKDLIYQAAYEANLGNELLINNLAKYLEKCDLAKQELRDRGYGWTGLDILETSKQVRQNE